MGVIEYLRPASVGDAVELLSRHGPDTLVMAGGTIAMPLINDGISAPERVMSLRAAGLDTLDRSPGLIRIGATCPLQRLLEIDELPIVQQAARQTGSWAIRNMGTAGGNLFAPPPAGDVTVALLALDATVIVVNPAEQREILLEAFHTGFMTNVLGPNELVAEIRVVPPSGISAFHRLGRRQASTPAVVTVAARTRLEAGRVAEARIALGAVGPHPFRARSAEAVLTGSSLDAPSIAAAAAAAADEADPATDGIATDWYRRRMTRLYVERALTDIATRHAGGAA